MKAHEVLSDEGKWTREVMARTSEGRTCFEESLTACSWCVEGALSLAYPRLADNYEATDRIENKIGRKIHRWNDDPKTTFDDVRNLLLELDI